MGNIAPADDANIFLVFMDDWQSPDLPALHDACRLIQIVAVVAPEHTRRHEASLAVSF